MGNETGTRKRANGKTRFGLLQNNLQSRRLEKESEEEEREKDPRRRSTRSSFRRTRPQRSEPSVGKHPKTTHNTTTEVPAKAKTDTMGKKQQKQEEVTLSKKDQKKVTKLEAQVSGMAAWPVVFGLCSSLFFC